MAERQGWRLDGPRVVIGRLLHVSFQRTPRIPGGRVLAPPPSHGAAPLWPAGEPEADVLVASGGDEAFWIGFCARADSPAAVRVLIDAPRRIDALTGAAPEAVLSAEPQNYRVCPPLLALDGVPVDGGIVQFLAGGADGGSGACERLTVLAMPPKSPLSIAPPRDSGPRPMAGPGAAAAGAPAPTAPTAPSGDPWGIEAWDQAAPISIRFRLVTHAEYARLSGQPPPLPLDRIGTYQGQRYP